MIEGPVIVVSAADVLNLQGLLRKIVAESLQIHIPDEGDDEQPSIKVSFQLRPTKNRTLLCRAAYPMTLRF